MYPFYATALGKTDATSPHGIVESLTGLQRIREERTFGPHQPVVDAGFRLSWHRIAGSSHTGTVLRTIPAYVSSGLHGSGVPLGYGVWWNGNEVAVGVGGGDPFSTQIAMACRQAVGAPESHARHTGTWSPNQQFGARGLMRHWGCLVGTPTGDSPQNSPSVCDVLLDGFRGVSLCYLVFCTPEPTDSLVRDSRMLRRTAQNLERTYLQLGAQANIDREALRARALLDQITQRLDTGSAQGLWRVSVLLGTTSPEQLNLGLGLLSGQLRSTSASELMPLRGFPCGSKESSLPPHGSLLTGPELAGLLFLPGRDRVGFKVESATDFLVDTLSSDKGVALGVVVDRHVLTPCTLRLPVELLVKHVLVVGHPGAGKTTTVHRLLEEGTKKNLPFLVIEPAKGEYSRLAQRVSGLRVMQVGRPTGPGDIAFKFNPFYFPPGFFLHTHIDYLKQCFIASFGLVPPTPYLLESAIYRAYARRGWNLVDGSHPASDDETAFPTLNDLLEEIDDVVDAAQYDGELSANLRAALKTRLGNLCIGPKGASLDTRENTPLELLYNSPSVIELRHLGADPEKAFVMGLLLARLYELRECGQRSYDDPSVRHLLVIEEAHRLLRRTRERAAEDGNMAHQAVEFFCNLLAEIRAYGQGVVVVDQLPTKLTSDAVKLCSTKVVHRLGPKEDRDVIGDAMVLTERQKKEMATLATGECLIHLEGMEGAARVRIPGRDSSCERQPAREVG